MAANEQTKLQINYSAKNGLMVNVYGDNQAEIEALLTNVQDLAPLILSVENTLKSAVPAAAVQNYSQQQSYTPQQPKAAAPEGANPECRHGRMNFTSGVGAKGPWKAWRCAAPKDMPGKCDPIWVR